MHVWHRGPLGPAQTSTERRGGFRRRKHSPRYSASALSQASNRARVSSLPSPSFGPSKLSRCLTDDTYRKLRGCLFAARRYIRSVRHSTTRICNPGCFWLGTYVGMESLVSLGFNASCLLPSSHPDCSIPFNAASARIEPVQNSVYGSLGWWLVDLKIGCTLVFCWQSSNIATSRIVVLPSDPSFFLPARKSCV